MTRHGPFVATLAAAALLLSTGFAAAQTTCPPECPAPGEPIKPNKKQGCFIEFGGVPEAEKGFKANCTDGVPECDLGSTPNECQFLVRVCMNNDDSRFPNCTPEGMESISVKTSKTKDVRGTAEVEILKNQVANLLAGDPNLNACTDGATISVPLKVKKNGQTKKSKPFKINLKSKGLGGKKAKDKLFLTCLPSPEPPPAKSPPGR